MSMLNFNKHRLLPLVILLLTACQVGPELQPAEPEPETSAFENEAELTESAPEPDPIDYVQQDYDAAIAALKAGEAKQAMELLIQVSRQAPEKPYVFTNLGLAYLQLQEYEPSESAFRQALEYDDDDAVAYNHLGILQRQQGLFSDARRSYQRAIDIDDDYAGAHLNLGILFDIYLQELDKALAQYQKYQALISQEDKQVAGWIVDIERRLKSAANQSQG
jgi:tetratricopeptide (TPR) repeat protein